MAVEFIASFSDGVLTNIIGGTAVQSVTIASLFIITIIVAILLAARLSFEIALIIVAPAIIVMSFAGLLPPLAFGIIVLLLALFFTGIVLAVAR